MGPSEHQTNKQSRPSRMRVIFQSVRADPRRRAKQSAQHLAAALEQERADQRAWMLEQQHQQQQINHTNDNRFHVGRITQITHNTHAASSSSSSSTSNIYVCCINTHQWTRGRDWHKRAPVHPSVRRFHEHTTQTHTRINYYFNRAIYGRRCTSAALNYESAAAPGRAAAQIAASGTPAASLSMQFAQHVRLTNCIHLSPNAAVSADERQERVNCF